MTLMTNKVLGAAFAFAVGMCISIPGYASAKKTQSFEDDQVADFSNGDITTSTLTQKGTVEAPYYRKRLSTVDADIVWDLDQIKDTVYLGTGNKGKVFRMEKDQEPESVLELEEAAIFALHKKDSSSLYFAASPGGDLYEVENGEEPVKVSSLGQKIVWDMENWGDALVAATGSEAMVVKVNDDASTESLLTLDEVQNILDIEYDPESKDLILATQGPGYVGRLNQEGEFRILLDPEQEEVRATAVLEDGSIVAAVNGVRSPNEKLLEKSPANQPPRGNQEPRPASFLARIYKDGFAEEWWTSPESPIHAITLMGDSSVIVAAGEKGKLYRIENNGETTHLGVAQDKYITVLKNTDGKILAGTGSEAAIYEISPSKRMPGYFESQVFDAKGIAEWGTLNSIVQGKSGAVTIATRTGNTKDPDQFWGDWSDEQELSTGPQPTNSSKARFLQYRLTFEPDGNESPGVDFIKVYYTERNEVPTLKDLEIKEPKSNGQQGPANPNAAAARPKSFTDAPPTTLEVTWKSSDPNTDPLSYDIYLRSATSDRWISMEEDLDGEKYVLETVTIPDGRYRLKVVASDRLGNSAGEAMEAEVESEVFIIDHTAPEVTALPGTKDADGSMSLVVEVKDAVGPIDHAVWRVGFKELQSVFPEDGHFDENEETFNLELDKEALESGMITFIVSDEAGNIARRRISVE